MTMQRRPFSRLESGLTDGAILLEGRKFDLVRVLWAYQRLIDALTRADGGSSKFLISGEKDYYWGPTRARDDLLRYVSTVGAHYQVCTQFHIHLFNSFRARAYLLGGDCCVADAVRGRYVTMRGRPLRELDGEPRIMFFGQGKPGRYPGDFPEYPTLPYGATDLIAATVLAADLDQYGFRFERGPIGLSPGGVLCQDCRITFPFEVYGEGEREYIRVRCVGVDGKPVKATPSVRN